MGWKLPEYSRNQIIKAGDIIKNIDSSDKDIKEALKVIDNWRASHAYPLQVFYYHFKNKYDKPGFIIAQRLKRLVSIVKKLEREPNMSLWTMQDLGGCRVIVPTIDDVYEIVNNYKSSRVRHILKENMIILKNQNSLDIEAIIWYISTKVIRKKLITAICLLKYRYEQNYSICGLPL